MNIEMMVFQNIVPLVGMCLVGGAAWWRIRNLELLVNKMEGLIRENNKDIRDDITKNSKELAYIRGQLQGQGLLNGHSRSGPEL